jgi:histidinol-phosphate aminotransferase
MSTPVYDRLVRPNIKNMKPYASARGTAKSMQDFTFLDAGENPYCPFGDDEDGVQYINPINRYSEPQPFSLLEKFARLYGTNSENILISRGSEEAIRLLMQLFCVPQKEALITCPPTFAMYPIEAVIHDVENIEIPRLGEFYDHLDVTAICEQGKKPHVKTIFICNPGNPSSTAISNGEIEQVIQELQDDCMIVVDEAYIDFSKDETFVSKIEQYPNLIVMRTLSKSYGAAGLRCGTTIAHPQVINYLRCIMSAYPVPRPVQNIAEAILSEPRVTEMQKKHQIIKDERDRMLAAVSQCSGVKRVFPSQANFLCVEVEDSPACVQLFRQHKIVIRDRGAGIPNTVNIAVGLKEENDHVLTVFDSL